MWQSLISEDIAGTLGDYAPLMWLPRKAAVFLFEYNDFDFREKVPNIPPLPPPMARDEFLDVHNMVKTQN